LESIQPGRCILSTELLQVFNAWLATNGHLPWSKETFGPRFKQHDETTKHGVRLAKISKLESLSRPPWLLAVSEVPRRPDATWESGSGPSLMPKTPPRPKPLLTDMT
jgi:hypothetical protein